MKKTLLEAKKNSKINSSNKSKLSSKKISIYPNRLVKTQIKSIPKIMMSDLGTGLNVYDGSEVFEYEDSDGYNNSTNPSGYTHNAKKSSNFNKTSEAVTKATDSYVKTNSSATMLKSSESNFKTSTTSIKTSTKTSENFIKTSTTTIKTSNSQIEELHDANLLRFQSFMNKLEIMDKSLNEFVTGNTNGTITAEVLEKAAFAMNGATKGVASYNISSNHSSEGLPGDKKLNEFII